MGLFPAKLFILCGVEHTKHYAWASWARAWARAVTPRFAFDRDAYHRRLRTRNDSESIFAAHDFDPSHSRPCHRSREEAHEHPERGDEASAHTRHRRYDVSARNHRDDAPAHACAEANEEHKGRSRAPHFFGAFFGGASHTHQIPDAQAPRHRIRRWVEVTSRKMRSASACLPWYPSVTARLLML